MAFEDPGTVSAGTAARASWANTVRADLVDLDDRLSDAETSVSDHEDRIDLLEANGPTANRIYTATVTLTDAQVKALPTTPITIVANPGPAQMLVFRQATVHTDFTAGAAYTNINGTYAAIGLNWGTASGTSASTLIADDNSTTPALVMLTNLFAKANRFRVLMPYMEAITAAPGYVICGTASGTLLSSTVENQALVLYGDNNGSGDWTGGHTSNQLTVHVDYSIRSLPAGYPASTSVVVGAGAGRRHAVRPRRRPTETSVPLTLMP